MGVTLYLDGLEDYYKYKDSFLRVFKELPHEEVFKELVATKDAAGLQQVCDKYSNNKIAAKAFEEASEFLSAQEHSSDLNQAIEQFKQKHGVHPVTLHAPAILLWSIDSWRKMEWGYAFPSMSARYSDEDLLRIPYHVHWGHPWFFGAPGFVPIPDYGMPLVNRYYSLRRKGSAEPLRFTAEEGQPFAEAFEQAMKGKASLYQMKLGG